MTKWADRSQISASRTALQRPPPIPIFSMARVNALGYPSGRAVTYQTGGAGHPLSAIDSTNSIDYATAVHYAPQGGLASLTGNGNLFSTYIYNSRLQPCWIY